MNYLWLVLGLLLGILSAAMVIAEPGLIRGTPINAILPQLGAPTEPEVRGLAAAIAFAIPTVLGLILAYLFRRRPRPLEPEFAPARAPREDMRYRGRAAPELQLSDAERLDEPAPPPEPVALAAAPPPAENEPVHVADPEPAAQWVGPSDEPAPAADERAAPEPARLEDVYAPMSHQDSTPGATSPEVAAALARLEASVRRLAERDGAGPAIEKRLAVIEAALGEIPAGEGVPELLGRFEELERRVAGQFSQIAAQIAEVAQLQRSISRTPAAASAPSLDMALPAHAPPRPRDPTSRRRLADAAAALRASLGETAPE